jgi:hypothetical protein
MILWFSLSEIHQIEAHGLGYPAKTKTHCIVQQIEEKKGKRRLTCLVKKIHGRIKIFSKRWLNLNSSGSF